MAKTDTTLGELVDMISSGNLRLPELQRRYVWPATRVRDLLDSLYRGYPSGTILVWETDQDVPERALAIKQEQSPFGDHKLLLDGQQRLTSMSAVLRGEPLQLKNRVRPIEIAFNLDHPAGPPVEVTEVEDDQPGTAIVQGDDGHDEPIARSVKERVENFTFVVSWRALLADPHWIKVSDIFNATKTDWDLLKPLGLTPEDPDYDKYSKRIQKVRAIRSYPYVMHVLERDLPYEEVAEIFVRVNSLGVKLRGSDLALAQITARWLNSLGLFEEFADECEKVWFTFDIGLLVRTMVVFATHQSRFRTVNTIPVARLQEAWEEAKVGLTFAINFLRQNAGIEDESLLSSPLLVIPLAVVAVQRNQKLTIEEESELLHWLFVANAVGHYSGSSESTLDRDLNALFGGKPTSGLMEVLKQQITRVRFRPSDLVGRTTRNALYQTAYLALRHAGAKDWWSGVGLSLTHSGQYHYVQAHHIFPQSVLRDAGYETAEINEIANFAFIGGGSNRGLGAKTPDKYLPSILDKRGQEALTAQCVPVHPELWKVENYPAFLDARRQLLAEAINRFLDGVSEQGTSGSLDVGGLIEAGESGRVEFKETLRFNPFTNMPDKELEKASVKSIAGFMNNEGGTLLIGVSDAGDIKGLERDLSTLGSRPNADGLEQYIRTLLNSNIGKDKAAQVNVSFQKVDGTQVAVIRAPAAASPIWTSDGVFYLRSGNTTQVLTGREERGWIDEHFH